MPLLYGVYAHRVSVRDCPHVRVLSYVRDYGGERPEHGEYGRVAHVEAGPEHER